MGIKLNISNSERVGTRTVRLFRNKHLRQAPKPKTLGVRKRVRLIFFTCLLLAFGFSVASFFVSNKNQIPAKIFYSKNYSKN
jgi:hypothetical protein